MKRLVLLGGGHAHLFVLDAFLRQPMSGVALTLVSPVRLAPYSGMMPGVIAGHYRYEDGCIDLEPLCHAAGCRLVYSSALGIDTERRQVRCADGSTLTWDVLSIDTGATPGVSGIPGAADYAVPVKPIENFLARWQVFCALLDEQRSARVAVVGDGAAGVEVLLALQFRMEELARQRQAGPARFTLIGAGDDILPGFAAGARRRLGRILRARRVDVLSGHAVTALEPRAVLLGRQHSVEADFTAWATGSAAPAWPRQSGLATDEAGFILVDRHLRSVSHPPVFAAGDVSTMVGHPHPRSGVYAVRAGPPLAHNLRAALGEGKMRSYRPQRRALALLSTGDKHAVATWGGFSWQGEWVWRWKDRIDRAFVARFKVVDESAETTASGAASRSSPGNKRPPIRNERT